MTALTPSDYRAIAGVIPTENAVTYYDIECRLPRVLNAASAWRAIETLAIVGVLEITRPAFAMCEYIDPYTFRRLVDVERIQFSTDGSPIGVT